MIKRFILCRAGASLMEYGLLLILVAVVSLASLSLIQMVISNLLTPLTFK